MGLSGVKQVACAYVDVKDMKLAGVDTDYFAGKVEFGPSGVHGMLPLPANITDYEKKRITQALTKLKGDIKTGVDFVASN
jgi:malate/lactate dehydrogenase